VTSGERDRKLGDPTNLKRELGTAHQRKGRYDPGWTPSEQRMRAKLMRQFIRRFDGPCGKHQRLPQQRRVGARAVAASTVAASTARRCRA
jgi:hypothetical protein